TSERLSAGASLTPSPVTGTVLPRSRATRTRRSLPSRVGRATRALRAGWAHLPLRRRAGDDGDPVELGGKLRIVPRLERAAEEDARMLDSGLERDRRGGRGVVSGDHDDLDAGSTGSHDGLAAPVAERVGEADQGTHLEWTGVPAPGNAHRP